MSTKTDYTVEEWNQLIVAPMMAGMSIIYADLSMKGFVTEGKAMKNAMQKTPADAPEQELVTSLVADIKAKPSDFWKSETKKISMKNDEETAVALQQISDTAAMLDGKAGAEEAAAYKQWVLFVAQTVAEAAKEGGLFSKKVLVSDKEKARIEEIKQALGA